MIGSLAARFKRRRRPPGGAAATTKTRAKKEPLMGVGEQTTDASHSRNSDQMTKNSSGGDTPAADDLDVAGLPLAIEMLAGRRTVRCLQCSAHLFMPDTSLSNPTFRCKLCWCLMTDPLWAPAREPSMSAGSVATIEGPPRESDESESDGSDDSDDCGSSDDGDTSTAGGSADLQSLEDQEWILLDNASAVCSQHRKENRPRQRQTEVSLHGSSEGNESKRNSSLPKTIRQGHAQVAANDGILLPESPTRGSNAAFFDDDVELVETFYD